MSGTLGSQLVGMMPLSAAVFDPATLSLSGWWRADYAGSPWAGTASAGASSGRNLSSGSPATTGTAVNGKVPASFDGSSLYLSDSSTALSSFVTTSAYSVVLVVKPKSTTFVHDTTNRYNELSLLAETGTGGAYLGVGFSSSGFSAYHFDGGYTGPETAASLDNWHIVAARYDGTNLKIRVDSGSDVSEAKSSVSGSPGTGSSRISIGLNYILTGNGQNAEFLEVMLAPSYLSNADYSNIRSYVNSRYGLSL